MNSPALTNILLSIIALFLFVMVVQNAMGPGASSSYQQSRVSQSMPSGHPTGRNPTVAADVAPFMGNDMYYQALRGFPDGCDPQRTLLDCDTPAARAVKQDVDAQVRGGKGPREVFDYIVEKYGLSALTDEAQRIRGARVSP